MRHEAAKAWSIWEGRTSRLQVDADLVARTADPHFAEAFARIECHYFTHDAFMEEGQLLRDIERVRSIPAVLIQGRYDVICPPVTAWELHKAWPESKLVIVPDAGHSAREQGIEQALVDATRKFAPDRAH